MANYELFLYSGQKSKLTNTDDHLRFRTAPDQILILLASVLFL